MPQRTDRIFQDQISETFGGSNYHHLKLNCTGTDGSIVHDTWIAPRAVRIINDRIVARVLMAAGVNTLDVFRNIGAGTDRTVIAQFEPAGVLVANTVANRALSTATSDNLPNVVVDAYGFFSMRADPAAGQAARYDVSFLGHYSFEDI